MNALFTSRSIYFLFLLLLGIGCVPLFATSVAAAEAGSSLLQANAFLELFHDRSRMIQITLVVVVLGCAMLWWRR